MSGWYEVTVDASPRERSLSRIKMVRNLSVIPEISVKRAWKPDGLVFPRYRIENHSDFTLHDVSFDCWTTHRHPEPRLDVSAEGYLKHPIEPGQTTMLETGQAWKRLPEPVGHRCTVTMRNRAQHSSDMWAPDHEAPRVFVVDKYWAQFEHTPIGRGLTSDHLDVNEFWHRLEQEYCRVDLGAPPSFLTLNTPVAALVGYFM
jgi:hypothetical protein